MANKTNRGALAAELGAGLLAAAGAGYYFYASDNAKKHRKIAAKWADALKRDVIKEAKTMRAMSPKAVARIVDEAAVAYVGVKNIRKEDVRKAASELKRNWHMLRSEVGKAGKKAGKKSVRPAKKTVKKVVRKTKKKARR